MGAITAEDYFGRMTFAGWAAPSPEVIDNATTLITRVNALLVRVLEIDPTLEPALFPVVTSGWRTEGYNRTIANAAPRSKHITGQAIDLADPEGELDDFLMQKHMPILIDAKLWMEHPSATKGWCHLQCVPPRSGNPVFYP